jgi:flagellar biosynthesis protein FlhF
MRLKSFYAKTMSEAMQMVRDTLGEDAVIVATREERGGAAVRVTAAIEPAFEIGRVQAAAPADDWLQYDDEQDEFAVAEELTEVMLRHAAPEDVMDNIISCATVVGLENPNIALIAAIEHLYHFRPLPTGSYRKAIMMVGAPGSGKTLAVAKMAARGVMDGLNVGVITCDTVRAGGIEQLQSFTKLLNVNLQKAKSPEDLKHIIADLKGCDQILIDSPGINPFDNNDIRLLAKLISSEHIEPHLVMAGGSDADEAGEMARAFAALGAHSLIPTRLDLTRRLGSILSAAHSGSLAFADASNTPKVADGLFSLTPKTLAKLLMPGSYRDEATRSTRKTGT